jgi:uncharacterized protein YgiB involved in biofilm formation
MGVCVSVDAERRSKLRCSTGSFGGLAAGYVLSQMLLAADLYSSRPVCCASSPLPPLASKYHRYRGTCRACEVPAAKDSSASGVFAMFDLLVPESLIDMSETIFRSSEHIRP